MTTGWPAGYARHLLETVDSTNAEAFRNASGAPLWVVAARQTAGKGRRAREWASPVGNFYGTCLLHLTDPPARVALRSFAAALALRDALAGFVGGAALALKWPNDVLLNGGKVAGILLESQAGQGGHYLAIGIGVNLTTHPDPSMVEAGALRPVSLLSEAGAAPSAESFLNALAPALAHWEWRLASEGFAPLRAEWLAHAARLGQRITARTGAMTREGVFETIDPDGNLVLRMDGETVAIPAADVFF